MNNMGGEPSAHGGGGIFAPARTGIDAARNMSPRRTPAMVGMCFIRLAAAAVERGTNCGIFSRSGNHDRLESTVSHPAAVKRHRAVAHHAVKSRIRYDLCIDRIAVF